MTYKETLDWMFAQLPMYQEKGRIAFSGKLDSIKALAKHLGNPEKKIKSIHVAGTNGKGSSSHMLASILQEAGYKVGLYTSPHLKDFRERIKINGTPLEEDYVVCFIKKNKAFFEQNKCSFFEMTVGMAFLYFATQQIDIAIIEVGLGGRLDSTNLITPEVSLITNIGYDHTDILGNTLAAIASEKGGIIKKNIPVVISEYQEETAGVFKFIAEQQNANIVFASKARHKKYNSDLLGGYQSKNIKGVVSVIKELKAYKVEDKHMEVGLLQVVATTGLLGRWQKLQELPTVICDTAHNKDGLSLVLKQIQKQTYNELHVVLGVVNDKNLEEILPLFPKNATYYFCKPNISRGLSEIILKQHAAKYQLLGNAYESVNKALMVAKKAAKETDFVYIGGSTFVVAEIV